MTVYMLTYILFSPVIDRRTLFFTDEEEAHATAAKVIASGARDDATVERYDGGFTALLDHAYHAGRMDDGFASTHTVRGKTYNITEMDAMRDFPRETP